MPRAALIRSIKFGMVLFLFEGLPDGFAVLRRMRP